MKYVVQYKYEKLIEVKIEADNEEDAKIKGLSHARLSIPWAGIPPLTCTDIWEEVARDEEEN